MAYNAKPRDTSSLDALIQQDKSLQISPWVLYADTVCALYYKNIIGDIDYRQHHITLTPVRRYLIKIR